MYCIKYHSWNKKLTKYAKEIYLYIFVAKFEIFTPI